MSFFSNEDGRRCIILEYGVTGEVIWEENGLYKVRYDRGGYNITVNEIFKDFEIQILP